MDDQALLRALGDIVREKSGEPDGELAQALSRYQRGQLSKAEFDALLSERDASTSFDRVQEAMRPVSDSFRAQLQSAIEKQIQPKKPFVWAWLGRWQILTAAAACALLIFVVLIWSPGPQSYTLPAYELTVTGVVKETRNGLSDLKATQPDVVHSFKQGAQATFVLRPDEAVTEPVQALVYLHREQTWQRLFLPTVVDESGAVRIMAEIGRELKLAPGDYTLWMGITKKGAEVASVAASLDSLNQWPHFTTQLRVVAPEAQP